jgi:hypothetical protein
MGADEGMPGRHLGDVERPVPVQRGHEKDSTTEYLRSQTP